MTTGRNSRFHRVIVGGWAVILSLWVAPAFASVFVKPQEALKRAFPAAEKIEPRDVVITDGLAAQIEKASRTKGRDRMVTFYTATAQGKILGHAVIHSHIVRTKRETFLLVFDANATILNLSIIAFFEPAEYVPTDRWLARFTGRTATQRLAVGDDVDAVSGATLSTRGITDEVRWILAAFRLTRGAGLAQK